MEREDARVDVEGLQGRRPRARLMAPTGAPARGPTGASFASLKLGRRAIPATQRTRLS